MYKAAYLPAQSPSAENQWCYELCQLKNVQVNDGESELEIRVLNSL